MDDLTALLANIERQHMAAAKDEEAQRAVQRQIARLNAHTPRRGGADLAAGERDDDDNEEHPVAGLPGSATDAASAMDAPQRPLAAEAPPPVAGPGAESSGSPEVDPYTPPASLYSREWLAEYWERLHELFPQMDAAIEGMQRAIQRAQEARP